jgi:hypothetical protein
MNNIGIAMTGKKFVCALDFSPRDAYEEEGVRMCANKRFYLT